MIVKRTLQFEGVVFKRRNICDPRIRIANGIGIGATWEAAWRNDTCRWGIAQTVRIAFMDFPKAHRKQIASTNPLERVNAEIKRRTDVVGIFPNENAIIRLVGALLLEQNDEWQLQRRYMQLEGMNAVSEVRPLGSPL